MKRKYRMINHRNAMLLALAIGSSSALAADGTWILNGNANWSNNTTAWAGNVIADGVGAIANFDTVVFSANRTITLDSARTIGFLQLGNSPSNRSFNLVGANTLTLDNGGGNAQITFKDGGSNANISVAVALKSNLLITNNDDGGDKGFFFAGAGGVSSTNGHLTITNTSHAASRTKFNSVISDGTAGNSITYNQTAGWSEFTAANTFSGTTTNGGGLLHINIGTALQNSALNTTGSVTGSGTQGLRIVGAGVTSLTFGGLIGSKNINQTGTGVFSTTAGLYGQITALTLNPGTGKSETYSGAIENGAAGMTLTKSGAGTQTLSGTNLYTGATNVTGGTLAITGSGSINNSSGVTVNGGTFRYNSSTNLSPGVTFTSGTIAGTNWNGSLSGQTIGAGQTISPGNSPGTASTGSQTWAAGGSYVWEMNNATGTAGSDPGWDLENGTGTLNITAASGSEFNLLVTSLTLANAAGNAVNFNDATSYNWMIADFLSITGFNSSDFIINTSAFTNTFTGTFGISLGGVGAVPGDNSQIYLTYTAIPEPRAALLGGLGLLGLLRRRRS